MADRGFLDTALELFVRQRKEWTEILVDWETRNQYEILDAQQQSVGSVVERGGGVGATIARLILRSHRGFEIAVFDAEGAAVLRFRRRFFLLFSDLDVLDGEGARLGSVHRRFGVLYKRYDLRNRSGQVFARVASPRWRLWTFPVEGVDAVSRAEISKQWGGALKEIFADADTYRVGFSHGQWDSEQRAVIFAAAISIDFDFFENNQGSGGLLDRLTN